MCSLPCSFPNGTWCSDENFYRQKKGNTVSSDNSFTFRDVICLLDQKLRRYENKLNYLVIEATNVNNKINTDKTIQNKK